MELYAPATGTFNVASNMATLTYVSSATLLKDGRVLITGRTQTFRNQVYGAELYDAAAGTSRPVANWSAREPFAAIALAAGRILFQYYEDYAQIYDPSSGQFNSTGGLGCFDGPPQATVVLNGKVLFTGGNDIGGSESDVELFDPAAGTFANNRKMSTTRDGHRTIADTQTHQPFSGWSWTSRNEIDPAVVAERLPTGGLPPARSLSCIGVGGPRETAAQPVARRG